MTAATYGHKMWRGLTMACRALSALLLLVAMRASGLAQESYSGNLPIPAELIPALAGRVTDQAGVLDQRTLADITSKLAGYEHSTGNQVVVVTLRSLNGRPVEDWGLAILRRWGIGQQDKNNGVVLLIAPNDRQLRIEVGYGLENRLSNATAGTIIQSNIIPRFKNGDVPGGIEAGVDGVISALGGTYQAPYVGSSSSTGFFSSVNLSALFDRAAPFLIFGFVIVFMLAIMVLRAMNGGQDDQYNDGRWGRRRSWYDDGSNQSSGGWRSSGWSSGGNYSSHSSGSSSGGGFSGGGGSGGGGGASGRW